MGGKKLGRVVSGSLNSGVRVLIEGGEIIEDYPSGSIVVIRGRKHRYLAMIIDSGLDPNKSYVEGLMNSDVPREIRDIAMEASREYASTKWIELALVAQTCGEYARVADTCPSFYSPVVEASVDEIKHFYGVEDRRGRWNIGVPKTPKALAVEIPLDIEKIIELSFGIFGKAGTGKTFLGNIIAGLILLYDMQRGIEFRGKRIRMLIFDMHSEYGLELRDNMGNPIEDGVAKIFHIMFRRYTPDPELAKARGLYELRINYNELSIDDLRLICPILGVTPTFIAHLPDYQKYLRRLMGDYWVWGLIIDEQVARKLEKSDEGRRILLEIEKRTGKKDFGELRKQILDGIKNSFGQAVYLSFVSQTSKLKMLADYPYTAGRSSIDDIVDNLVSRDGLNITISMGRYEKETPLYMIIANLIARRSVDPRTNLPHPPQRILNVMEEAGVNIDPFQDAELQIDRVLKQIKPLLPIKFQRVTLEVKVPVEYAAQAYQVLKQFTMINHEWLSDGSLKAILEIPAGIQNEVFNKLAKVTKGNFESKILKREDV